MLLEDDDSWRKELRKIGIAAAAAACTTLATGLVTWALDALKAKKESSKEEEAK